jgi:ketosteroid isomerase-like protein
MPPEEVANQFNECINRRNLAGLAALMTDDHAFTDTLGATVPGKEKCVEAWRGFFEQFPDYCNTFTDLKARGQVVIAVGYSTCATEVLNGPAIWTAEIRDGQVSHWRVYKDTLEVRSQLMI